MQEPQPFQSEFDRIDEKVGESYKKIQALNTENRHLQEMLNFIEEDRTVTFQYGTVKS